MKPPEAITPMIFNKPGTFAQINHIVAHSLTLAERGIYTTGRTTGEAAPYDTKARLYEFLVSTNWYNRLFWGTIPEDYTNFAKTALEESKGTIIDVGCGGLTHTAEIYSSIYNELVLVDNSIEMLRIAKRRLAKFQQEAHGNILLLHADAFNLPYRRQFDNLFSFGMLHLFNDKAAYLDSILDALKEGGRFYISSLTTDRKISAKYIEALHKRKEMGPGMSSAELMQIFTTRVSKVSSFSKGSMVFIKGIK